MDRDKFHASFAADVPANLAAFMADSQVPWGVDALGGPVGGRRAAVIASALGLRAQATRWRATSAMPCPQDASWFAGRYEDPDPL
jgi:hypothetical protein